MTPRPLPVLAALVLAFTGCLNVTSAREEAAQRWCQFEGRCGEIAPGQNYATLAECLTDKRADFQNAWPTDRCEGRLNPETYNVCLQKIQNTTCNDLIDAFNTAVQCGASEVCNLNTGGCNCGQGQTCCNNSCVNLQGDRNNCGACGTTCGPSTSCNNGVCR